MICCLIDFVVIYVDLWIKNWWIFDMLRFFVGWFVV